MAALPFPIELVRRHAAPVPRYTSYPTAPHFHGDVDEARVEALLRDPAAASRPLSLYVHVPFCRSLCWYCGCATEISRDAALREAYVGRLEDELARKAACIDPSREVVQIHWGGGTPSDLSPALVRRLGAAIARNFRVAEDAEVGIEIDPRGLERAQVEAMAEVGFGRASIGVQDTRPEVQEAIHRVQPFALVEQTVAWLREVGISSINIDLIHGLPGQTPQTIRDTLAEVLSLAPDRLAIYGYAHLPERKPAQRLLERAGLPMPEERLAMMAATVDVLTAAGYVHVGMDHWARPEDELARALADGTLQRNFQGYGTRAGADILGVGVTSISSFEGAYVAAPRTLAAWEDALERGQVMPAERWLVLSQDDRIRRDVIGTLMCSGRLDLDALSARWATDLRSELAAELASLDDLVADGLLVRTPEGVVVTHEGRYLLRTIAARFDAWLARSTVRYSQAV